MADEALSLCMIVRNEERLLARCLDSVVGAVSEIVVVDTGSTDSTRDIAVKYGARVAAFDFTVVDFAGARNHAVERAKGKWIMVLDADEVLDPTSVPLIRDLIAGDENAGYYFERLNRQRDAEQSLTDYVVRLFPNRTGYRFRGRVHETVDSSILAGGGRLVRSGIRIDHDFARDADARRRRNLWYIDILNEEIAADPGDYSRLKFLAAEYHQLGMFDKAAGIAEYIASLAPCDAEAHLHAGVYHLLYKVDRARARADFARALALRPKYAEAESFLQLLAEQDS